MIESRANDSAIIRELRLQQNYVEKNNGKVNEKILIPVLAQKIFLTIRDSAEIDIFSQTVLNFYRLKRIPSIIRISNLMQMPISAIERIVLQLQKDNYLSKDFKIIKENTGTQEKKVGYVFYERITGSLLEGVYVLQNMTDRICSSKRDKLSDLYLLEDKITENEIEQRSENDIKDHLNNWIRMNWEGKNLVKIDLGEEKKPYYLPIYIYFGKRDIVWNVKDIYTLTSDSFSLKKFLRKLQIVNYKNTSIQENSLQSCIDNLCDKQHEDDNKQEKIDNVVKKSFLLLPCGNDFSQIEIMISQIEIMRREEFPNKEIEQRIKKRIYSFMNKAFETLLAIEFNEDGKIRDLWDKLKVKQNYFTEEESESFSNWINELDKKRKIADHADEKLFSDDEIDEDINNCYMFASKITGVELELSGLNKIPDKLTSTQGIRDMRIILDTKIREWEGISEDVLIRYVIYEYSKSAMDEAIFWESVLFWYIHSHRLYGGSLIKNWREKLKENISISEKDETIIDKLCRPRHEMVEKAYSGNRASLEAYAAIIILRDETLGKLKKDNEINLAEILGDKWWHTLLQVVESRDNHIKLYNKKKK